MGGRTACSLWHADMPHSGTFLNNCWVYAAGGMDETLPMFYDDSMQNIKEHTDNFDTTDCGTANCGAAVFEPEASGRSCPPCAVESSLHGEWAGEQAAGHAGDCDGNQAARCAGSQTGCHAGAQEEGRAENRVGRRVGGWADDRAEDWAERCVGGRADDRVEDLAEKDDGDRAEDCAGDRAEGCPEGRPESRADGRTESCSDGRAESQADGHTESCSDGPAESRADGRPEGRAESYPDDCAQAASHFRPDASSEEDFAGFVKHNIASSGIFGGVSEKGAAPQNRSAADWGIDVAVALVAFAFGCAQMVITASSVVHVDAGPYGSSWVNYVPNIYAYLAVALTTAPLILRREAPWFVLALTLACYVFLSNSMGGTVSLSPIGPIVAVYTVASERARGEALAAAAVVGVCAAVVPMGASSVAMALVMRIENVAFVVVAALGGFGVRMYHAYMEETRRRLAEAERTREELAARRVADERVRIAREVHDITAHSLSAVTIQAAAAERLIDLNPAAAKEAIADIRSVSKSSLDEIRSLIGVLRGDEAAEHAPAEGTERMADVVSFLRRAGIEVDFDESDYDKARVPAFVDMALFSLARESATNAVRHAHASRIRIELASSPSKATLVFSDDGVGMGSGVREHAEGHGLEGMGERIEALNGAFTIESEPGRGCTIRADVPLEVVHDDEHR